MPRAADRPPAGAGKPEGVSHGWPVPVGSALAACRGALHHHRVRHRSRALHRRAVDVRPHPLFGIVAALCFAWLGIVRLKQAGVVLRYRRNIHRLPKYMMTSAEMPVSNEHLFIGKGFRWTQKHTQRLADTYLPQFASYVEPSLLYERARRLEKQLEFASFP